MSFLAAALAEASLCETPAFQEALSLARKLTTEAFLACSNVAEFRRAGGRSAIAKRAVEQAITQTPGLDERASELWPVTSAELLRRDAAVAVLVRDWAHEQEMRARRAQRGAA